MANLLPGSIGPGLYDGDLAVHFRTESEARWIPNGYVEMEMEARSFHIQ